MTVVAVMQPKYFPWCGYFALAGKADVFVHLDNVQLSRPSSMTRTRIANRGGNPQWLSVDVERQPRGQDLIGAIHPDERHAWRRRHIAACRLMYGSSAFGATWLDDFCDLVASTVGTLADLNIATTAWASGLLGIPLPDIRASGLATRDTRLGRLEDLCRELKASTYLASSRSRPYMTEAGAESLLPETGARVTYLNFDCSPYSSSAKSAPRHGLSILDHFAWLGVEGTREHLSPNATAS